jgi:nitroreductase
MSDSVFDEPLDLPSGEGPLPPIDWNEFKKVVETRRSVRVFDRAPIPEADVRAALDMALLAPNSSNLQPWEFHWVRTPEMKKKLVAACLSQSAARTAAELIVCVARVDTWPAMRSRMLEAFAGRKNVPASAVDYYRKLVPIVYSVGPFGLFARLRGLAMFFIGLYRPVPREPSSPGDMTTWAVKSTALACQNLMLALRAKGWDSCPMEGVDSRRAKKLLGLPGSSAIVMVVAAGRRSSRGVYGPRIRFDRALFVKER